MNVLGTVHNVEPEGNCGFASLMKNLIAEGLLDRECTVTSFRKQLYDFDSDMMKAGMRVEDRIVDHTYSQLQANHNRKKVFKPGINFWEHNEDTGLIRRQ